MKTGTALSTISTKNGIDSNLSTELDGHDILIVRVKKEDF